MSHSTNLTRRSALTAAAAIAGLAAGAGAAVAAAEHPDAELHRLWDAYTMAYDRFKEAQAALEREDRVVQRSTTPAQRSLRDSTVVDLDGIVDAIRAIPAETTFGAGVKLAALKHWSIWDGGEEAVEAAGYALMDIERLTGTLFVERYTEAAKTG